MAINSDDGDEEVEADDERCELNDDVDRGSKLLRVIPFVLTDGVATATGIFLTELSTSFTTTGITVVVSRALVVISLAVSSFLFTVPGVFDEQRLTRLMLLTLLLLLPLLLVLLFSSNGDQVVALLIAEVDGDDFKLSLPPGDGDDVHEG